MRYLVWLLALSFALPACAQKKIPRKNKAMTTTPAPPVAKQAEPVLVFQRTPCFGRCPVYTATIFADGRVDYDGQRFVDLLGKHTLSLPVAKVDELLAEAKRIKFNKLQERYAGNTSDLPANIITVHPAGQPLKAVYAEENVPTELQEYIKLLQRTIDPLTSTLQDR